MHKLLFEYACRILTRRRYTVTELRKKLTQRVLLYTRRTGKNSLAKEDLKVAAAKHDSTVEAVITQLLGLKFLDDKEYVQLFIEDQLRRKPQGVRLLKRSLSHKGIAGDLIQMAIKANLPDELELARAAVQKKMRSLQKATPQKRKEKLYRFLASRGFESGVILKVVKE